MRDTHDARPSATSTEIASKPTPAEHAQALVLAGWGLPGWSTLVWQRRLRRAGFAVVSFAYRSRACSLDENARRLGAALQALPPSVPVHLVGHSLGGLVILQALARQPVQRLGRVVLVGSPFQGSAVAQVLQCSPAGRWLLGRSVAQWKSLCADELPPGLQLGTIAGTSPLGIGRLFAALVPPHDGTVSLAETHVPFASGRLMLPVTHSQMLVSADVARQIEAFLRTGTFLHP
jgi:pimeloyl-ACP methyl ester carboxylesterase